MMSNADIEAVYALSPLQEGLLFHHLQSPSSRAYLGQDAYRLEGPVDATRLRQAWQRAIDRHPALRTAFVWDSVERPAQVVLRRATIPWTDLDWRERPGPEHAAEHTAGHTEEYAGQLQAWLEHDRERGIDRSKAPLLRIALIRLADEVSCLVVTQHHLILDGWSYGLLLKEVMAHYQAACDGGALTLPAPPSYRDFVEWSGQGDSWAAEEFWRDRLQGVSRATPLPFMRGASASGSGSFDQIRWELPPEKGDRLRAFARANRVSLATLLQGAWGLLLGRYSGGDAVFGSATSLRPAALPGAQTMIGPLMNTLPLRVTARPDDRVRDVLARLQHDQGTAQEHGFAPLVQIQRWSNHDPGEPFFHSVVVVENYPTTVFEEAYGAELVDAGGLRVVPMTGFARTHYPLTLHVFVRAAIAVEFVYDGGAFGDAAIRLLAAQFERLLDDVIADPAARVGALRTTSEREREALLARSRGETRALDDASLVHEMISAQARKTPAAAAVIDGTRVYSFDEFERATNRLAGYLREAGVGPDVRVAILLERSWAAIVAIVAVLKAGGAFVPLDPASPSDRLQSMTAAADAAIVITDGGLRHLVRPSAALTLELDALEEELAERPEGSPADVDERQPERAARAVGGPAQQSAGGALDGGNLAYVLFTSGSTGRPKGVAITHRGLTNYLRWAIDYYDVASGSGAPLGSSLAFDLTITSVFAPLAAGRALTIVPEGRDLSPLAAAVFSDRPHSFVKLTPSHLRALNALRPAAESVATAPTTAPTAAAAAVAVAETAARVLIVGGEMLLDGDTAPWRRDSGGPRIINEYGPTETVVGCVAYELEPVQLAEPGTRPGGPVPIGTPIPNTEAFVFTPMGELAPAGIAGELFIGGAGVARGYVKEPALTADKFVPHPFSLVPGARLYRTGDQARWRADGVLEYLGRRDGQVKIRGYRIELGEIEAALLRHAETETCAVVAPESETGTDRVLVAYVVSRASAPAAAQPTSSATADRVREWLRRELPEYMMPAAIVVREALPLNENGKVDRRALLREDWREVWAQTADEQPVTDTERALAAIWGDLLARDAVGRNANFFRIGGHSLLATQLISRIQTAFQVSLPIQAAFDAATIAELAVLIDRARTHGAAAIAPEDGGAAWPEGPSGPLNLDALSEEQLDAYLASLPGLNAEQDGAIRR